MPRKKQRNNQETDIPTVTEGIMDIDMALNSVNLISNIFVLAIRNVMWGTGSPYMKVHKIRYKHAFNVFSNG
jgi:hypothetical protein